MHEKKDISNPQYSSINNEDIDIRQYDSMELEYQEEEYQEEECQEDSFDVDLYLSEVYDRAPTIESVKIFKGVTINGLPLAYVERERELKAWQAKSEREIRNGEDDGRGDETDGQSDDVFY